MTKIIRVEVFFQVEESVTPKQIALTINRNGRALAAAIPVTSPAKFGGCVYEAEYLKVAAA